VKRRGFQLYVVLIVAKRRNPVRKVREVWAIRVGQSFVLGVTQVEITRPKIMKIRVHILCLVFSPF
jgi:hypothetical protein